MKVTLSFGMTFNNIRKEVEEICSVYKITCQMHTVSLQVLSVSSEYLMYYRLVLHHWIVPRDGFSGVGPKKGKKKKKKKNKKQQKKRKNKDKEKNNQATKNLENNLTIHIFFALLVASRVLIDITAT